MACVVAVFVTLLFTVSAFILALGYAMQQYTANLNTGSFEQAEDGCVITDVSHEEEFVTFSYCALEGNVTAKDCSLGKCVDHYVYQYKLDNASSDFIFTSLVETRARGEAKCLCEGERICAGEPFPSSYNKGATRCWISTDPIRVQAEGQARKSECNSTICAKLFDYVVAARLLKHVSMKLLQAGMIVLAATLAFLCICCVCVRGKSDKDDDDDTDIDDESDSAASA